MKIWAHRGCSQLYPENTLLAFEKAMNLKGLEGIELDVQLTRDGQLVVCHDERVDRTTDGIGEIARMSLAEIKQWSIYGDDGYVTKIPTMEEVLDLLEEKMQSGLKLNIELKNSINPYPGMEEQIVSLVHRRGLQQEVVYSTFYAHSLERLHQLDPEAELGILDRRVSDCYYKQRGLPGVKALHPFWRGMDLPRERLEGCAVRGWLSGHLYPEKPTGTLLNLEELAKTGLTDLFLNEPERYLSEH